MVFYLNNSSLYGTLNEVLVKLFNEILHIEEQALKNGEFKNITITEIHIIEAIGLNRERNMTSVSKDLDVTIGTLTIAINNLLRKGYVNRSRSLEDRRIVLISLTEQGKRAFDYHEKFHKEMINATITNLNDEEMQVLISSLENINIYFKEKYNIGRKYK